MPIVEIALRMITLAGFVPQEDIEIQIVGARDGEKLHEELFDDNEMRQTTCMPGILTGVLKGYKPPSHALPARSHSAVQFVR